MGAKQEYEFLFEEAVLGKELFGGIEKAVNKFDYEIEEGWSKKTAFNSMEDSEENKAERFKVKVDSGSLAKLIVPNKTGLYYEGDSESLLMLKPDVGYSSFPFVAHRYGGRSKSGLKEQDIKTTNEFMAETYKELGLEVNENALKPVK